ncbi:MAG: nucleotidyltransferase domain-containing protein [Myxococcales bacterium]
MRRHGCHTAILYGSWVRGQATPQSDVDILCVRQGGPAFRDARVADGHYVDAFIYPEADLLTPQPDLLDAMTSFPLGPDTSLACASMHKQLVRSVKVPNGSGRC